MTIAAFAISTMPFAASVTLRPSGVAQRSSIARAAPSTSSPISPPRKYARVEPAEHDVGVGHGRLDAAAPVTDRARVGARALRPDAEQPARVDPRDRAAPGADLDEVDDRRPHRVARERHAADPRARVAADVVVLRHRRPAVLDQADLRRRAAHVEGEDVGPAERLAEVRRGDHAGGRPRLDHEDRAHARPRRSRRRRRSTASRAASPATPAAASRALDPLQVALDDGPDRPR